MPKHLTATLLTLAVAVAITGTVLAIPDPDNLGQWNKPTNTGPDKVCPGFLILYNLSVTMSKEDETNQRKMGLMVNSQIPYP